MGWPIIAANILGGVAGWLTNRGKSKGYQEAGNRAAETSLGAFNYLKDSAIGEKYMNAGGGAMDAYTGLLGLGGSMGGVGAMGGGGLGAYKNYLNSAGYQSQMNAGQQAITGSAAARGLLGSGSTAKALTRFGQDHAAKYFDNYLGHLGGIAGMGLQSGGLVGNAAMAGYGNAARFQYMGDTGSQEAKSSGWNQLIGGLGGAFDAWNMGRSGDQAAPAGLQPTVAPNPFDDPRQLEWR